MAKRRTSRGRARYGHTPERHSKIAEHDFKEAALLAFQAEGAARVGDCSASQEHLTAASETIGAAFAEAGAGQSGSGSTNTARRAKQQLERAKTFFGRACRKPDTGR